MSETFDKTKEKTCVAIFSRSCGEDCFKYFKQGLWGDTKFRRSSLNTFSRWGNN